MGSQYGHKKAESSAFCHTDSIFMEYGKKNFPWGRAQFSGQHYVHSSIQTFGQLLKNGTNKHTYFHIQE